MPTTASVLLVISQLLPDKLSDFLSKRNVHIELVNDEELQQLLPVMDPDLLVLASGPELPGQLAHLEELTPCPNLVIVVERDRLAALRAKNYRSVKAYIPSDLAPAAIAHRLATLAVKFKRERPNADFSPTEKASKVTRDTNLAAKTKNLAQERTSIEVSAPTFDSAPVIKAFQSVTLDEFKISTNEQTKKGIDSLGKSSDVGEATSSGDTLRAAAAPPQALEGSIPAKAEAPSKKESPRPKMAPPRPRSATLEGLPPALNPEFSVLMPIPVTFREALTEEKLDLHKVRLALLDTDLTRADALTSALRGRGVFVHPVTPDPVGTRWPLLRRFAPQALVVDEKSLARGSAEWVERFRGDPFLQHVPLIVLRFSRLFLEDNAKVRLDLLLKAIEHLGEEEFALLDKLKPGHQVDLNLSQVPPLRLLMMLSSEDRNTRLDCRGEQERMVWHLGPGYAGNAKLLKPDSDKVVARLTPEEALTWLVTREDCQVAVHEHTEPLAHPSESKDAFALMEEMTAAFAPPTRHQSARPGSRVVSTETVTMTVADAPNGEAATLDTSRTLETLDSPAESEEARHTPSSVDGVSSAADNSQPLPNSRIPRKGARLLLVALGILTLGGSAVLLLPGLMGNTSATTGKAVLHAPPAPIPKNGDSPKTESSPAVEANKGEAKNEASTSGTEGSDEDVVEAESPFSVAVDTGLPSCEEKLGDKVPNKKSIEHSVGYYRQARNLLMKGKAEDAWIMMCTASLLDPEGPAPEGLAEFYLSRRSLAEAERWIQSSLKGRAPRRTVFELHGDIESQKGNEDKARSIWLSTMKLTGKEEAKLKVIARKHTNNAKKARKIGDLARAEREIRRATTLWNKDAGSATEFAELLSRRGAKEAAAKWASLARQIDPSFGYALIVSGRIAEARQKPKEAAAFYDQVSKKDPFYRESLSRRSRL